MPSRASPSAWRATKQPANAVTIVRDLVQFTIQMRFAAAKMSLACFAFAVTAAHAAQSNDKVVKIDSGMR
jgi:hypothetical protein